MTSDGLVTAHLRHVLEDCLADRSGERAQDVPQLADADPELFGIALATLDGHVHAVGDADVRATLQSLSKPFAYALAVADRGVEECGEHVDVEPSGEPFDAISISPMTDRPRNPMINAGALTASSLVRGADADERAERVRALCSGLAGRELTVDEDAAAAELDAGQRNRAIAHLLLAHGRLGVDDPESAVRAYVRQCSLLVDVRDLAVMAATLAGGGVNPLTGERVLETGVVRHVLSVMLTCGMYDAAGDWVATVGLPAKSGISGGLLAAVPAELGLAAWSPRLDRHGRSVRGLAAVQRLSAEMDLHALHVHRGGRPPVRSSTTLRDGPSSRPRSPEEAAHLDHEGHRARVLALHGDVLLAAAERVVRAVEEAGDDLQVAVVDLSAVDEVVPAAAQLLLALPRALPGRGRVLVVDPEGLLAGALERVGSAAAEDEGEATVLARLEDALAAAEDHLLALREDPHDGEVPLGRHPLLEGAPAEAVEAVGAAGRELRAQDGEDVPLDPAALHLVLAGRVALRVPDGADGPRGALAPGSAAGGPVALPLPEGVRGAAVGGVRLLVLDPAALERLEDEAPAAAARLWRALATSAQRVAVGLPPRSATAR